MQFTIKKIISLAAILLISAPFSLAAQTGCVPAIIPVTMSLTADLDTTVPSASVGFHTKIKNSGTNSFPDSMLLVDVIRKDESGMNEIVDRFIAPEHVTIFGRYSGTVDFVWRVPAELTAGTYTVVVTLAPQGAVAAQVWARAGYPTAAKDITIQDGAPMSASIRVITVNGQAYKPLSVAHISDGAASATAVVHNGSAVPYIGTITWRQYRAEAKVGEAPVDERSAPVELHPGTDTQVVYQLPQQKNASYYLEGELSNGRQSVFFDILLDSDDTAFPWATCSNRSFDTTAMLSPQGYGTIGLLAILIAAAWYIIIRRRGHSRRS